jgi:hypothetical protein
MAPVVDSNFDSPKRTLFTANSANEKLPIKKLPIKKRFVVPLTTKGKPCKKCGDAGEECYLHKK